MAADGADRAGAGAQTGGLIPAATVLLVRDGAPGLEVFMVQRHRRIDFASGALVFPGGRVDAQDAQVAGRARGLEGLSGEAAALRIAAIREAFEEAGILLARRSGALLSGSEAAALGHWREKIESRRAGLLDFLERENLQLDAGAAVPYAHWITPKGMPKRFDTYFFIAAAPPDHAGAHDGRETTDSVWIRPRAALEDAEAGRRQVIFPTRMNLALITECANAAQALAEARRRRIVTVEPKITQENGEAMLSIPPEAGYPVTREPLSRDM